VAGDASLDGRRAVVTGASRGIGAAIARALDARGVRTLLVARTESALNELAASLKHACALPADLRDSLAPVRISDAAIRELDGPIDVLVNNAGSFVVAPIAETSDAVLDELLSLNLAAPFRLVRALLPVMVARNSGHIVTIGSVADRKVFPGNAAYAAAKYGARALHEATLAEARHTGVRVTLVSPGPVNTAAWDPYNPDSAKGFTPRAQMLVPDDVADAVVWALTRPVTVNIDELRLTHS
jgi:NADP-dependent 3-hydroxy acid dehydrogenase YdfG